MTTRGRTDPEVGGARNVVVRSTRYEAFVNQASVGIEIDQITIVWYAARANKRRQPLVVRAGNAIEHLIDNTVDAGRSHLPPIEYSTFVSQVKGTQENDREIAGHRSQCVLLYLTPPIFVTGPA